MTMKAFGAQRIMMIDKAGKMLYNKAATLSYNQERGAASI